jgi:hypothetical protein
MKSKRMSRWVGAAAVALATLGGGAVAAAPAHAIAGGTPVAAGQYPFYVAAPSGCGGALVASTWVITARHCANDPAWAVGQKVRIGWSGPGDTGLERTVTRSVLPPEGITWDIVLLEVDAVESVAPVPLADPASVGDVVRSVGAGGGSGGLLTSALFEVDTTPDDPKNSKNASLWARSTAPGVGIRGGDSGSPLITETHGAPQLVGVAAATDRDRFGLWTGTSYAPVREWIASVLHPTNFNGTMLSAATGSKGFAAIDGDASTVWRADGNVPVSSRRPAITLDVRKGPGATATSLRYLPVFATSSGMVTGYTVYGSRDGSEFVPLTAGTWSADHWMKQTKDFPAGYSYLKFEITSAAGDYADVGELIFNQ